MTNLQKLKKIHLLLRPRYSQLRKEIKNLKRKNAKLRLKLKTIK